MARIWGTAGGPKKNPNAGNGNIQCTKACTEGSKFCSSHDTAANIEIPQAPFACENPWGLTHGVIDQHLPIANKDGFIVKKWKHPTVKEFTDNGYEQKYANAYKTSNKMHSSNAKELNQTMASYDPLAEKRFATFQSIMVNFKAKSKKSKKSDNEAVSHVADQATSDNDTIRKYMTDMTDITDNNGIHRKGFIDNAYMIIEEEGWTYYEWKFYLKKKDHYPYGVVRVSNDEYALHQMDNMEQTELNDHLMNECQLRLDDDSFRSGPWPKLI